MEQHKINSKLVRFGTLSVSRLGSLVNLEELNLAGNHLRGAIPAELGNLTSLERLDLDFNAGLSGPLPRSMAGLHSLSFLSLSGTELCASPDAALQTWLGGVSSTPGVVGCGDYDQDDDGLIEIVSVEQLNAIRWDPNGDGQADHNAADFEAAFLNATAGMGCPDSGGCTGYELTRHLVFDTNHNGRADSGDAYWNNGQGWEPISTYDATFEGNSRVITGLFIDRRGRHIGLFGSLSSSAEIRNLGLAGVSVSGGDNFTGGLAGRNGGAIRGSYATGSVTGGNSHTGGLMGVNTGTIHGSYATGSVTGWNNNTGGLVGWNTGTIRGSYATGSVTGGRANGGLVGWNQGGTIHGSYATGSVTGRTSNGGLVGQNSGTIRASSSYWDTQTSGQSWSDGGEGKTTRELQSPTGYTGIYAGWNLDLDGDGTPDDPWDFRSPYQYPVLK